MRNSHSIDTGLDGNSGIIHVAADVGKDLPGLVLRTHWHQHDSIQHTFAFRPSLQIASQSILDCSEAHGLVSSIYRLPSVAVSGLEESAMAHIVNPKVIEGLGDLNLLLGIKKGVGELLTLAQSALNDLEAGDIAQEISDADIVAVWVASDGGVRVLTGLDGREARMRRDIFFWKLVGLLKYTGMNHTHAIGLGDAIYMPIGLILSTGTHGGGVERSI